VAEIPLQKPDNQFEIDPWTQHEIRTDLEDGRDVSLVNRYVCICGSRSFEVFAGGPQEYKTSIKCVTCGKAVCVHEG